MADIIIGSLLKDLNLLLVHEAKLLSRIEDEVMSLCDELTQLEAFLKNLEGNQDDQGRANELVGQLRDIVYDVEDVIDPYIVNASQSRGYLTVTKLKHKFVEKRTWAGVAKQIESIRKKVMKIHTNKQNFSIRKEVLSLGQPKLLISREVEVEVEAEGLDHMRETIIKQLISGEPGLLIIPIVGMGGSGKTTLARKVYSDQRVQNHFNFRAWVYVSQEFNVRKLLLIIIKCGMILTDEINEMSDVDLMMELRIQLRSKRYLIVLDDVWKTDLWDELNEMFARNLQGSRIILTTRYNKVALNADPRSDPHHLRCLNDAESWELLSKKVFQGGNCPQDLEELGRQIAKKCQGLPLAINAIAGILKKKENMHLWWPKVLARVSSFLTENTQQCMDILTLSYEDLPLHVKQCFLYFGLFPEDMEISTKKLIRLWIAEGFIKQKDGEPMENSAQEYLEELIDRNLIQASKLRFDGGVKACRIHDLLRCLCILKAKEEKFLEVCGGQRFSFQLNSRRLAIHSNTPNFVSSNPCTLNIRSLLCFGGLDEGRLSSKHWKSLYKGFPLLRVLDLWGVIVDSIPNEVEKLICLRYLRLRSHTAQSLPLSICNLWNLQTLEVRAPLINRPWIGIWKMQQLRHLNIHRQAVVLSEPRDHDDSLNNLQTLSNISPGICKKFIFLRLPNLVKLGIYGDLKTYMDGKTFDSISGLDQLQTLELERDRGCESLSSLDCVAFPKNITKLTLSETQLSEDPMQKLGKLHKLQVLKLINGAYVGDELHCSNGGFPQLKVLKLINLGIKKWDISTGSMGSLQSVVIRRCSNLRDLPSALQNMSTLRELELWWPNAFVLRDSRNIQNHMGEDMFKLTIYHSETS